MAYQLPTNPTDLKKINGCIKELVDSKVRQKAEETLRKEILTRMKEEFGIERKEANKLFTIAYNGKAKFDEMIAANTELECAVENLRQQGEIFAG